MKKRLKKKAKADELIKELLESLSYAIQEADGWYDDCHGGFIESTRMDKARKLIKPTT